MSDDVTRYEMCSATGYCECTEVPTQDGDIVKYDDHARIVAAKDAEIAALRAERDAARKDAERYVFVRSLFVHEKWADVEQLPRPEDEKYITAASFDAAIDAARAAEGGTPDD